MLFRPAPAPSLLAIAQLIERWNSEADRFRIAAIAAARGIAPSPLTLAAAGETRGQLLGTIDEIDRALIELPAGHADFAGLLRAQATVAALLESVGRSRETLEMHLPAARAEDEPDFRVAAE